MVEALHKILSKYDLTNRQTNCPTILGLSVDGIRTQLLTLAADTSSTEVTESETKETQVRGNCIAFIANKTKMERYQKPPKRQGKQFSSKVATV